tara:strand:+ start:64 stop:1506 length:1443 start_codon:yes stop_codon:yes gene_type:complete
MDVPTPYLINDTRKIDFFKKTTFSNFLKKDVFDTLFKKIDEGKLPEVCFWTAECVVSGYIDELWERSINYYSRFININSPFLPYHFFVKLVLFLKLKNKEHFKKHYLDLRNSQEIRNHFCELTCILTHASKSRKSISLPKIKKDDFSESKFKSRLKAKDFSTSMELLKKDDPKELTIVINEFSNVIKEYNYKQSDAIYWLIWILEWEKIIILKTGKYKCSVRDLDNNVEKKYCSDVIWVFWLVILKECISRNNKSLSNQVKSLFEFFKFKYTPSKKKKRLYMLLSCIQMLDPNFQFNAEKYPIYEKYFLTLQACSNVNTLYKDLKKEENLENDYVNSKIKQEATYVITKYDSVKDLDNISKYRQELKEKKAAEQEYKKYLEKKKLERRKNREQMQALKKCALEKIDTHIINNSHNRPLVIQSSIVQEKIQEKKPSFHSDSKTLHLIDKIDKKLKIKEPLRSSEKELDTKNKNFIQVVKTN